MYKRAEKHLKISLNGNMNIATLKPLALIEIMTDFAKKEVEAINYTRCCETLKNKKIKDFQQFKNSYLIEKSLNTDPFGFRKDLTDIELVDKYALYLKNNL